MKQLVVYKVENKINDKVYIGATCNFSRRKAQHIHTAKNNSTNSLFHKDIRDYGKDNFEWKIIEKCSNKNYLEENEKYYIKLYGTRCYNDSIGGKGSTGFKFSKELKEKLSAVGKNMSIEKREKINKSHAGRVFSDEAKINMSKSQKLRRLKEKKIQ